MLFYSLLFSQDEARESISKLENEVASLRAALKEQNNIGVENDALKEKVLSFTASLLHY